MVAAVLGPEHFRSGLQVYLKRHQYGNTTTADLWRAWSEVSGIDVASLMASWTQQMGFPYVQVVSEHRHGTAVEVTLEQHWFLADGSGLEGDGAEKIWTIPLFFATSASISSSAVLMTQKTQTFTLPVTGPDDWIKINAGQQALLRVNYSTEMVKRLIPAIREKVLGPEDRAALLLDVYALAKANVAPLETVVELLKAYDGEDNGTVWTAIAGILNALKLLLEHTNEQANKAFLAFAGKIVKGALRTVGWAPAPDTVNNEPHVVKLWRSTVLSLVESFCGSDEEVVAEARRRFDAHWESPEELPAEYKVRLNGMGWGNRIDHERVLLRAICDSACPDICSLAKVQC